MKVSFQRLLQLAVQLNEPIHQKDQCIHCITVSQYQLASEDPFRGVSPLFKV